MSAKNNMETLGAHPKYQKVPHTSRTLAGRSCGLEVPCILAMPRSLDHRGWPGLDLVEAWGLRWGLGGSVVAAVALCKVQNISEHLPWYLQIRDLNSGTFGFVELALDKSTGQQVAVKFIERGDKVLSCTAPCGSGSLHASFPRQRCGFIRSPLLLP